MPAARPATMARGSIWRSGRTVDQRRQKVREGQLHADSQQYTQQSSGGAEQQRLDEVDFDDLAGACAQRLHDGDGIEPLREMRAHGHGHADSAKDERHQAHERQQAGGLVESVGERRVGLAIVGNLGLGQDLDELRLEVGDGVVRDGGPRSWVAGL